MTKSIELVWHGKGQHVLRNPETNKWEFCGSDPIPPRPLIEIEGFGDEVGNRTTGRQSNLLIKGENLYALQALQRTYAGQIKLIYIDPPYNTGNEFPAYDDNFEHSVWLSMMYERLLLMKKLLHPNGVICIHIDDNEAIYLKVLMDAVFGRDSKHLVTIYLQVRYPDKTLKQDMLFHKLIEQVHCYRNDETPEVNQVTTDYDFGKFCWSIKEKGKPTIATWGEKRVEIFPQGKYEITRVEASAQGLKEIWATGALLDGNSSGRFFRDYILGRAKQDGYGVLYKVYDIGDDNLGYRYFTGPKKTSATKGKYYQGVPASVQAGDNNQKTEPIPNYFDFAGAFGNCRQEGGVELRSGKKPEALLKKIIELFTSEGDYVLDCFAGSGTTGAVAHKLKRNWIMVELNAQSDELCLPRLKHVISGKDQTGISKDVGWNGGGGFRLLEVGAPLMITDPETLLPVLNPTYKNGALVRAVCHLEGFELTGDAKHLHGRSGEHYAHITEDTIDDGFLRQLARKLPQGCSLTVYVTHAPRGLNPPPHIIVKRMQIALVKPYLTPKKRNGK